LKRLFFIAIFFYSSRSCSCVCVTLCCVLLYYCAGEMCVCVDVELGWGGGGVLSLSYGLSNPLQRPGSLLFVPYFHFFLSTFLLPPPSTPLHFMSAFLVSFRASYLFFVRPAVLPFPPFWPHYVFQSYRDAAVVASSIVSLHKMKTTTFPIQREVSPPPTAIRQLF
jgi:hypothetical protein